MKRICERLANVKMISYSHDIWLSIMFLELYIRRKISIWTLWMIAFIFTFPFVYLGRFFPFWHHSLSEILGDKILNEYDLCFLYYTSGTINLFIIIPFLITLFYFYYRQQKNISESYLLKNEVVILTMFITSMLFWLIFFAGRIEGIITFPEVAAMIGCILFTLCFIKSVFKNLNISYLIRKECEHIRNLLGYFSLNIIRRNDIFSNVLYDELKWRFEILYQLMHYAGRSNSNLILDESLDYLVQILEILGNKVNQNSFTQENKNLCENILRNHRKYIIILYEKNHHREFKKALNALWTFYPQDLIKCEDEKSTEIIDEFYLTFWILSQYFLGKDRNKFQNIMQKVIDISKSPQERLDFIILIKSLLIYCMAQGNISYLTEICYLITVFGENILENVLEDNRDIADKNNLAQYVSSMQKTIRVKNNQKYYKGMLLYVVLQCAIKTIELQQYESTGFLVKYIVSNFTSEELYDIYSKICENQIIYDEKLEQQIFMKNIQVYFLINKHTAEYCLKKLTLLLRIQQWYRNVNAKYIPLNIFQDDSGFENKFDKEYCLNKILNVGNEYGLLALENSLKVKRYIYGEKIL